MLIQYLLHCFYIKTQNKGLLNKVKNTILLFYFSFYFILGIRNIRL